MFRQKSKVKRQPAGSRQRAGIYWTIDSLLLAGCFMGLAFYSVDGGVTFLRNVDKLPNYTASNAEHINLKFLTLLTNDCRVRDENSNLRMNM
jgi:hypothetical protein